MNKPINVLSLFDGISCGQVALERAGIQVAQYFASEIDKHAITVTQHNYPSTVQLGDVTKVFTKDLPKIDLLTGGFCCQSFSFAGKQLNFNDPRGKLFFECVRILQEIKECNPNIKFLFENVKMKKEYSDIISEYLVVDFIQINSSLVSAQNRVRNYWTNIPKVTQPEDKHILTKDIIEHNASYEFVHQDFYKNGKKRGNCWQYDGSGKGHNSQNFRASFLGGKMACLRYSGPHGAKILTDEGVRKTTIVEHERLQNLPDHYTESIEINKGKAAIGNGWTVNVIAHIFSFLAKEITLNQH